MGNKDLQSTLDSFDKLPEYVHSPDFKRTGMISKPQAKKLLIKAVTEALEEVVPYPKDVVLPDGKEFTPGYKVCIMDMQERKNNYLGTYGKED